MAADQLMSSYVGHGTHAARPATPNVNTGVSPVYYETDTTNTFVWSGSAWVQVNGGSTPTLSVSTKTTTYTITSTDDVILADATSAGFTVSLPTAVGWTKRITVKKIDSSANAVTVGTTGGQTIDGQSSRTLAAQFSSVTLISDNANWRVSEFETPLTSKGDLAVGLAAHDMQRLAVGSDGQILTADSAQATGIKWAAAAGALTQLALTSLGSPAATVNFSSISGSYNALLGFFYARTTSANSEDGLNVTFNGASTGFDWTWVYGNQTSALSAGAANGASMLFDNISGGGDTANRFAGGWFLIPNYAGANWKALTWQALRSSVDHAISGSGQWRSTAAITSMLFTPAAGSLATGSLFGLYGVN